MRLSLISFILILIIISPVGAISERVDRISEEIIENYQIEGDLKYYYKDLNGGAETRKYPFNRYGVILDSEFLQDTNDEELKGLLAHELAHIEDYSSMTFPEFLLFGAIYILFEDFQRDVERETDKTAIGKGFGKELLAFREYSLKSEDSAYVERVKKNYLSPEEIIEYSEGGI